MSIEADWQGFAQTHRHQRESLRVIVKAWTGGAYAIDSGVHSYTGTQIGKTDKILEVGSYFGGAACKDDSVRRNKQTEYDQSLYDSKG